MKLIILLLTVVTLLTVVVAASQYSDRLEWSQQFPMDAVGLSFVIAFMGWLPAPLDLSVWHSLWAIQKQQDDPDQDFSPRAALFDFNVGYIGTTVLALFFMALGALVLYGSGELPTGATPFAQRLIQLYQETLGTNLGFFVSIAALTTMFSTTLTCLDALPRSMAQAHLLLVKQTEPQESPLSPQGFKPAYYYGWLLVLIVGALVLLSVLLTDMVHFLKIATILSFLTAPFFALVNYRLVTAYLPVEHRPSRGILVLSWLGIAYLFVFCGLYVWSLV